MPTFTQAILLGADRLSTPPTSPHPALTPAWDALDWNSAKDTALLEASALLGTARRAGALAAGPFPAPELAPEDTQPLAPPRATAVLRRLLAEELRALLPEWMEFCARHGSRVPPFFLRTLFDLADTAELRARLLPIVGQRGLWLARQRADWSWILASSPAALGSPSSAPAACAEPTTATSPAPAADPATWDTGSPEERLALLRALRAAEPAAANALLTRTWNEETGEFRARALEVLHPGLSLADEPLLTRAVTDRRKEVRALAQALLASLAGSALARRAVERAAPLLTFQRGLLRPSLEVTLPTAFDPAWKADGIEEKPPAGLGEKAFWAQQLLALVPVAHWATSFGLDDVAALIATAERSEDWGDLLLAAWQRTAVLHREPAVAAALIPVFLKRRKPLPGVGEAPLTLATSLLALCDEPTRWRLVAAEADLAWTALPLLTGAPSTAQAHALLQHLAPGLRGGFNPGGSPAAALAARRVPPTLRDTAAHLLTRDEGLTKAAEAFLQALDLRAELHAAFSPANIASPRP